MTDTTAVHNAALDVMDESPENAAAMTELVVNMTTVTVWGLKQGMTLEAAAKNAQTEVFESLGLKAS